MNAKDREHFANAVMDLVEMIPHGRVTSYKKLAKACGYSDHSRMVGRIMSETESLRPGAPAHRVVSSSGLLSGRTAFGPASEMQTLLESEGVKVVNNRVCNLKELIWDPIVEFEM